MLVDDSAENYQTETMPRRPMAYLVNGLIGFSEEVRDGFVVGVLRREEDQHPDIVLNAFVEAFKYVSQNHAQFTYRDGKWELESRGRNGTTVIPSLGKPYRLACGERAVLQDGDALSFAAGPALNFVVPLSTDEEEMSD